MPKHSHDTFVATHEAVPTETAASASAAAVADRPETHAQPGMARLSGSDMNKHIRVHHALARPFRALLARHHGAMHPAPATGHSQPSHGHSRHGHGDSSESTASTVRWLLPVLLVAQLMVILDITAVNIALPSLSSDLGISGASISWAITSYTLVFGSLLLFGGRAADLVGRRRIFLTGLAVFTASSLAAALAGTATTLFIARAGQGLGAALLSPAALSLITAAFHGPQRVKALAAWGAVGGAGAAVGVLFGGLLTEFDWRLIFYVNLPVAVALAAAALTVVPADTNKPRWRGLDLLGAILATASLGAIVYAITQTDAAGWTSARTLGIAGAGVAGLAAFVAHERQTSEPLLQVKRLADRAIGGGLILMLFAAGLLFALFLLCSFYLQNVLGTGPLATGLGFLPLALAAGAGAHAGGRLVNHAGVRMPLAAAFVVTAVGMALLSRVGSDGSYLRDVLPGMLVAGLGLGVALVSVSVAILTGARQEETGMLSGLNTSGHELGGTIGIAVFGTIAAAATGAIAGPAAAEGIANAFLAAAVVASAAGLIALVALPKASRFLPKLRLHPQAMPIH
jgi:EmrB/QacA subfamily drug resistance transporter